VTLTGQANGFNLSGVSWVTVIGFAITKTTGYGIVVSTASHVTISNNHVSYAGQPQSGKVRTGIRFSGVTSSLVAGNVSDHNSDYGIALVGGSTGVEVRGNATYNNAEGYQRAAAGIRLYASPGNIVHGNITHDNEDSGIECYTGSHNTLLYDNVAYNNGDHGIDNYQTTGQRVVSNTVYKNVTAGINVEGGSTGATLANNVSVDNGIKSPRTHGDIRVESGSTSGTTMDYDLAYLTVSDTLLIWDSTSYPSLSSFQSKTGQEAHGFQGDPRWADQAHGDFRLSTGSPAIDSANSGASGQPSTDIDGLARVDDPATPNTGAGPRPYDDRGAYEFSGTTSGDAAPMATLAVSPTSGQAPLTVTADASGSTDADTTPIASYRFDFGDGSPDAVVGPQPGATATHTYASPGTYTVTVAVTDTAGLSSTATSGVSVVGEAPPAAALSLSPSSGVINLNVTADASASTDTDNTPIASFSFDFGDGSGPSAPSPTAKATHTYTAAGAYTVTVMVTDTAGLSSSATATVTVTDNAPNASLTLSSTSGRAPLAVTADASASTDTDATPVLSYAFNFGDGTVVGPQTVAKATHAYTKAGTFTVTVTVTDTAGLSSSATRRVKVR
jgi:parallel beta-helix repeat protein